MKTIEVTLRMRLSIDEDSLDNPDAWSWSEMLSLEDDEKLLSMTWKEILDDPQSSISSK